MKSLTEEQRRMAEENHNLIYAFASKNNLDLDEWYDVLAIGYLEGIACRAPDEGKGKLSTLVFTTMRNNWFNALGAQKSLKRTAAVYSLDAEAGDAGSPYEALSDPADSPYEDMIAWIDVSKQLERLSEGDRLLVILKIAGFNNTEIAQTLSITVKYVFGFIRNIRNQLKEATAMDNEKTANQNKWTPERLEKLREMVADNKTAVQIAAELGVSVGSVTSAKSRHHIQTQSQTSVLQLPAEKPKKSNTKERKGIQALFNLASTTLNELKTAIEQLRNEDSFGWYHMGLAINNLTRIQEILYHNCQGSTINLEKESVLLEGQSQQDAQ